MAFEMHEWPIFMDKSGLLHRDKEWTAREHLAAVFTAASISSGVEPEWTPNDHAVFGFMCADAMIAHGEAPDAAS